MSKLTTLMRRAPKRTAAVFAAFAVAILAPLAVHAWGPDRPTYTYQNPAPHVTFNSMTGTPNYGDERNFVRIKEATAANNTYVDNINLQAGKQYTVMVYYHNNASSTLNDAAHDYAGVAINAKMRVQMPSTVKAGEKARITGFVSADNAKPSTTVWDEAYGTANSNIALRYVPNSATIYSNGAVDGQKMPESLYTTGANLGYDKLDGKLPGCNEFAGWVTYNIVVDQPNFEVSKEVAKKGTSDWKESINAVPGEEVDYRIHYKNTGTTDQNDVVIKDVLPTGVTYVPGTTQVSNAASNFQWTPTTNNEVTKGGLNIGNYAAGGGAYVKFTAKLPAKDALACGPNTLINKGIAETNNGNKSDNANVVIKKDCEPVVKYTCDSLDVKKISDTSVQFTTNYTVQNATFKNVTYVVRNASGTEIYRTTSTDRTLVYTQTTPGKYSVEAIVTVTVNGYDKTVPVGGCKANFEIEKKVIAKYTCNDLKVATISRTEFRFSTAYSVENATFKNVTYTVRNAAGTVVSTFTATTNSSTYTQTQAGAYSVQATVTFMVNGIEKTAGGPDCKDQFTVPNLPKEITVCELATKKIVTIKESEFDSSKYSKNLDDCKEAPETIKVCEISTKQIVTINKADYDETKYTTDFSKCEDTPVTPPELPTTGAGENIVAIVGLGAMIASIAYYVASRRALNQ